MRTERRRDVPVRTSLALTLLVLTALPASAAVVDIDQNAALQGGVTPGDTAGFPVTILLPGSYRLTSNLDVRAPANPGVVNPESVTAIDVRAPGVTLDLGGFAILGPTQCSGTPLTCTPVGNGIGISGLSQSPHGLRVSNGAVVGMGGAGVMIHAFGASVEHITASKNGSFGILLVGGRVSDSTALENGLDGVETGLGTVVEHVTSLYNGVHGIRLTDSGTVVESVADGNGGDGITSPGGTPGGLPVSVRGCSANYNGGDGIDLHAGTVSENTASSNVGDGIAVVTGTVKNNTVTSNGTYGLDLGKGAGYDGNTLIGNHGGPTAAQVRGGVELGKNLCDHSPKPTITCP
ncbi:MAG TPA: right-handed parallel beta-helix repeat-containing protein [Thermoanaerobaculia bacterium]|jgi:parallel beta-helix repeat protein|nr:right-handed parallel beta-helix repeat-containing protein [Thermoanaerobaculia bacterium]